MKSDSQRDATHRRAVLASVVCKLAANLIWFPPLILYFVHAWAANPQSGAWLTALTFVVGIVVGKFPVTWFRLAKCEVARMPYRRLGVRRFRKFVHEGELMNRVVRGGRDFSVSNSRRSLVAWHDKSVVNERVHWAWLMMSLPALGFAAIHDHAAFAVYLALENVPINIFPIMLQRDTRSRLDEMLSRPRNRLGNIDE